MSSGATISEVIAKAGISISIVSRVLNNTGPVDEEAAGRVRATVSALKAPRSFAD